MQSRYRCDLRNAAFASGVGDVTGTSALVARVRWFSVSLMWVCQLALCRATYRPLHTLSVACVHRCRRLLDSGGQILQGANPRGCQSGPFCRFAERPGACSIASWSCLMRRSPGHRMYIGSYCICPVSKIPEGLRGKAATILAMLAKAHGSCSLIHRSVPMPQLPQSRPLPRPHVDSCILSSAGREYAPLEVLL